MRAAHLLRDPPPWILEDFLARRMLGSEYFSAVDASVARWPSELFAAFRAHFAVRARLAEDVAVDGLGANRRDYVILGAGADTFAWRHPLAAAFTIWEVDHPTSQAWKREALERADLAVSPNIRLVPVDLATIPLEDVALPHCATWNWLGVTQYLEKSATAATLQAIAAKGSGTTLVVEFLLAEASCDALGAAFRARSIEAGAQAGEPMVSFYEPREIDELLHATGFNRVQLLDSDELSTRFLPQDSALQVPNAAMFAIATT